MEELNFAVGFAKWAGQYMLDARGRAVKSRKLDRTVVTNVDREINKVFIAQTKERFGVQTSVAGEESSALTKDRSVLWVIDPIDGTGEYVDDELADEDRTACVGISLLQAGVAQLSVVFNPWRHELWVADRRSGTVRCNDEQLDLRSKAQKPFSLNLTYDFSHWDGVVLDTRVLASRMQRPPLDQYSAISQACAVAAGKSCFAVFPGDTLHDIAPGALLVELAGGVVADVHGKRRNQFYSLRGGTIFAINQRVCDSVARLLG